MLKSHKPFNTKEICSKLHPTTKLCLAFQLFMFVFFMNHNCLLSCYFCDLKDMYDPRGSLGSVSPVKSPPPLPKPPNPKAVNLKPEDYPHLNRKQLWLLQQAMNLFKNKEYDLALQHYEAGNELNPTAEEFQFGMYLCEGKLKKEGNVFLVPNLWSIYENYHLKYIKLY